ncbi:Peroxiredoxin [Chitinophaga ginsengisegetis]|uniref:Peroxiredoxin n=1 Tax=Chitinophaga ginsengisegetis TaxID=393003 RepID=A0A1T5NL92_9BACT|nr:TlpA disulfide reductase family protein [Chitinophaga ginsengisegetis]SKD00849.1 Peroxiredoxin [Chitinophaga ginsengisegetis]
MKKIINTLLLIFTLAGVSIGQTQKTNYIVKGHIKGLKDSWVFQFAKGRDSVFSRSGEFTFKGLITEPTAAFIYIPAAHTHLEYYLDENAVVEINSDLDSLETTRIKGGVTQNEFNKYREYLGKLPISDRDEHRINAIEKQFIKDYNGSFVSLNMINQMSYNSDLEISDPQLLKDLFDQLTPKVRASKSGKRILNSLEVGIRTNIGQMALDFSQPDSLGKPVSMSSFRGKYVFLDFWASWCGPCRAENPNVLKAYEKFKDRNFTVLSVSIDTNREAWLKAVQEDHLPWVQVCDLKESNVASKIYAVTGIPTNFLIDPQGKIIGRSLRGEDLIKKLAEVIPE